MVSSPSQWPRSGHPNTSARAHVPAGSGRIGAGLRRLARLVLLCAVTAGGLVLVPDTPPGWERIRGEHMARTHTRTLALRGALRQLPGLEFHYGIRMLGSGAVNIDLLRLRAAGRLAEDVRLGKRSTDASVAWRFLGPVNIAGRIRALAAHPARPEVLYAGAASGGVFRSTDAGLTWMPTMDDAPSLPVGALAVHPADPELIVAGTGEPVIPLSRASAAPGYTGTGILRSTDAGGTWNALPWPGRPSAISRILLHPASPDTMLVGTREGVARSTDGGMTWQLNALPGIITDLAQHPEDAGIVYAAIGNELGGVVNGVYRSDAGGRRFSWRRLSKNFPAADSCGRIVLATTPADPQRVLAMVSYPITLGNRFLNDFFALLRSTDGGESWERLVDALPSTMALEQAHYNFCLAVSPVTPGLVFAGGIEVWRSVSGGERFQPMTFAGQIVHVDQHAFLFHPDGSIYVGNDGGVFRTTDQGFTWEARNANLATAQFYSVTVDRQNVNRVYGGTQDNGTLRLTGSDGNEWSIVRGDVDGGYVAADGNFIYTMGALIRYPFRSTNGGQLWTDIGQGLGPSRGVNWLQPLLLHPADKSRLFTATTAVFGATDVNVSATAPQWRQLSPELVPAGGLLESVISTLTIAPGTPSTMYAGTGTGRVFRTRSLLDASPQWTEVSAGLPNRWISGLAVSSRSADRVYAVCSGFGSGHVFRSEDGGATWLDISADLPDVPVNAIRVSRQRDDVLFIGTDLGVWRSDDDGASWRRFGAGLPNVVVYDLELTPDHRLLAATHGRGMWSTDASVGMSRTPIPGTFEATIRALPPSGLLRVDIRMERPESVEIQLYTSSGRRAGRVTVQVDGSERTLYIPLRDLSAGPVYFTATAAGVTRTGRFLLLR